VVATSPSWLTAFLDVPAGGHAAGREFWPAATGWTLSASRGAHGEFATLQPADGDAHLRLQQTGSGAFRAHLDLHVDSVDEWTGRAVALGATVVARPGHVVLQSPGGFTLCLVPAHDEAVRTPPTDWGRHRSIADQLTVDVTPSAWETEQDFWSALTGWPVTAAGQPAYARLQTPATLPLRVLLQRLDSGPTSGHLDLATDDRPTEVARLEALGATVVREGVVWATLSGPDGSVFCVTDRDPDTGLRPA
jgi:hypothetical protein